MTKPATASQHDASVNDRPVFSTEQAASILAQALSLFVGRGRRWSYDDLATATGIKVCNLRAFSAGTRSPTYPVLASICGVLGGEFTTRLLAPVGIGAFEIPDPEADDSETVATLADVTATIAKHRSDRVLDHRERAIEARDVAPRLICEAGKMMARVAA